jgi:hypothetical protein
MIYLISTDQCDYFWYNHEYYFVVYNFPGDARCFGINMNDEVLRVYDVDIKNQLISYSSNLDMKDKVVITENIKGRISQILEDTKFSKIIEKI